MRCLLRSLVIFFFNHLFVFLFWSFKSSLNSLDNIPLSDMSFENITFQSVAYLFIFFTESVTVQENLILMKSSLSILSFMDHTFGVISKKPLPNPRSSSRSFVVLCFTFCSVVFYIWDLLWINFGEPLCLDSLFSEWMSSRSSMICWVCCSWLWPHLGTAITVTKRSVMASIFVVVSWRSVWS